MIGSTIFINASVNPVYAIETATSGLTSPHQTRKIVKPGNATANDFTNLIGEKFQLLTEDGVTIGAILSEMNLPKTRYGLRFRREHFSIVFDVKADLELTQGQYILSNTQIESMELFMVPVDLPTQHKKLEAIFS